MELCFIGTTELILIGGLALLLVGGKKLPEMMRGLGKGVREFKNGINEPSADNEIGRSETDSQQEKIDSKSGECTQPKE